MEKLSKNFIWMAAANVISGFFSAITGIYLARILMPEAFGYLSYAFTIIFFFLNFIDLGLSTYGIREIAGDSARFSEYFSEIASFRLVLAVLIFFIFIASAAFLPETTSMKILMMASSAMLIVWALASEWAFQGTEEMHMVFISFAVTGALQLAFIYIFIKGPSDLLKVPFIYIASALPITILFLKRLKFKMVISFEALRKMMKYLSSSMVIWSISVFAQVYNSMDILILGLFRSLDEVGYFTVARRVIGSLSCLMIFMANATLPRLSSACAITDGEGFNCALRKFLKLAAILTAVVVVPMIVFCKPLVIIAVGPQYTEAVMPLKIMLLGLALVMFNLPYSTALIAARHEKEILKQAGASAALSIFLNFALIPKYGMIGASISFVAAEVLAIVWILWIFNTKIRADVKIGKGGRP